MKIAEGEHGEWRWFDTNEFGDLSIPVVPGAGDSFGTRLGSRDKQLGETRLRLEDALKQDSVALAALTSVVKPHQFDFRVAAYHFQIIDSFWQGALVIEIPTGSLEMKDGKAEMAILGLIKNGDGAVVDRLVYEGSRPVSLKEPITFTQPLMMPLNLYTIELAIVDKTSNKASVQIAKINPPPTPAGLSLSDMVLVRKFEPGGRRQYDPLMHQGRRVIPQLTSNYTIGDHPAVFFTVFPSQPNNEKVLLDIDYFVNGKPMGRKQSEVIRGKPGDGISFTLEPKPHEGSAEMRVTVTQGSETVTNMATFTVAPLKADSR